MKTKMQIKTLSIFLVLGLLLSACSVFSPTPNPQDDQATVEAAVAQTLQALSLDLTSTAAAMPTSTFTEVPPTETPTTAATDTPAPTATIELPTVVYNTPIPATPRPTLTPTEQTYACQLVSTSPESGKKINTSTDFDASWVVKNTGSHVWDLGYVDLRYNSGTKMQTKADIFDVKVALKSGDQTTLTVDMKTPSSAGKYSATWYVTIDGTPMCTLTVSIEAVKP